MKNLIALFIIICLFACQTNSNKKKETKASNQWVSLFNGESFDGWHIYNGGSPYGAWSIEDQAMKFSPNNKKLDQIYSRATRSVFEEDKDAIEWIEDQWARDDRPGFRENHVPSDEGAVRMRRIVYKLAAAEAREAGA